ncbi:hypothetical protein B0H11DRAFT_1992986 [Mycena galericulata]|nr:hypothetical protein B0H11DRAFT_1992986 [Mycena galericulata]
MCKISFNSDVLPCSHARLGSPPRISLFLVISFLSPSTLCAKAPFILMSLQPCKTRISFSHLPVQVPGNFIQITPFCGSPR